MRVLTATLVCLVASAEAAADQNALTDYFGPREISIGEAMRASASGNGATTLNPAGLSLSRQLEFQGAYGYRPEDNASIVAVSACDSTVVVPGCFYYTFFDASPKVGGNSMSRRVHQFGITASRAISKNILLGVNSKYFDYNSELTGERDASGFAMDAGLIFRIGEHVNLAAVGYNLIAKDTPQYPMAVAGGVAFRPFGSLQVAFDALWDLETAGEKGGRYGGGAEYFFGARNRLSGFPIRAGAVHDSNLDSTFVTAGLGYVTTRFGLDVGMKREVAGGDETIIQAGLRLFGPAMGR